MRHLNKSLVGNSYAKKIVLKIWNIIMVTDFIMLALATMNSSAVCNAAIKRSADHLLLGLRAVSVNLSS